MNDDELCPQCGAYWQCGCLFEAPVMLSQLVTSDGIYVELAISRGATRWERYDDEADAWREVPPPAAVASQLQLP